MIQAFLFTISHSYDGVEFDSFIDVSALLGHNHESYSEYHKAVDLMLDNPEDNPFPLAELVAEAIKTSHLRARMGHCDGPALIKYEYDPEEGEEGMSQDDLLKYLRAKQAAGELQALMEGARI